MDAASSSRAPRRLRLAILDDSPFVRLPDGQIRARASLFHRFAEAVVRCGPFEAAAYLIPVAGITLADESPQLRPIGGTFLRVVPTAPFNGIAGYLRRAPLLTRRNWPIFRDAVAGADLLWLKLPASNALLAAAAARRSAVPSFTWIAGSARAVVAGQARRGAERLAALGVATAYDGVTAALSRTRPAHRLDDELFTSLVTNDEIRASRVMRADGSAGPVRDWAGGTFRIAWAGRIVADKGLVDLLAALGVLRAEGLDISLEVIGDGPDRAAAVAAAEQLQLDGAVRWAGFLEDREQYLDRLRAADVFVLPSRAEGVPKVLVDAMAAGLPIVATEVGAIPRLLDAGRLGHLVPAGDATALAGAIRRIRADAPERLRLRTAGLDFAAAHTMDAQAERLVSWLRSRFPALPWLPPDQPTDAPR